MAHGPSSAEFKAGLAWVQEQAEELMERTCDGDPLLIDLNTPIYSFDNWSGHKRAADDLCIDVAFGNRAPLPAHSPDMHKVIEHVFNNIEREFGRRLWFQPAARSIERYMNVLEDILNEYDPAWIRADIESLYDTYHHIISRGGKRAEPPFN